ncbi:MAG: hypothetical protein ACLFQM_01795 [Fidelibacterota bacterium]
MKFSHILNVIRKIYIDTVSVLQKKETQRMVPEWSATFAMVSVLAANTISKVSDHL